MSPLSTSDVSALLDLMSKHHVTELEFRGLRLKRVVETSKPTSASAQSVEELLKNAAPDTVDRFLMLQRTKGVGA